MDEPEIRSFPPLVEVIPARRRALAAIRSRRWRARQGRSRAIALVEYDHDVVDMLVWYGWLGGDEVADPKEIDRAITDMLAEAAQKPRTR
jgi:hypothetical protein